MWSQGLADWESDNGKRSAWNEEEVYTENNDGEEGEVLERRSTRADPSSSSVPLRLVERDLEIRRQGRPKVMEGLTGLVGDGKG